MATLDLATSENCLESISFVPLCLSVSSIGKLDSMINNKADLLTDFFVGQGLTFCSYGQQVKPTLVSITSTVQEVILLRFNKPLKTDGPVVG